MDFSVLISIYKNEQPEFLRQCFDSIFSQTLPASEVILVEDGPLTEELYSVIRQYEKQHHELKIIKIPQNMGLGNALNEGLRHCSNDLVARMDSDDISCPHRFKEQVSFMESHPDYDVVSAWVDEFLNNPSNVVSTRKLPQHNNEIIIFGRKRNPINHPVVMFRHKAVKAAGYYPCFPKAQVEDYDLWVRMIMKGSKFYNIPHSLLYYRLSDDFSKRRGGVDYSRREIPQQYSFYKQNYISFFQMVFNVMTRTIIRLLPCSMREIIYKKFLR